MRVDIKNEADMRTFGVRLGALLRGGDVIDLVGDVGVGKTTLTKGIAAGMEVDEELQSPSFTISRVYEARESLRLAHYDFYRLHDAGIMTHDLMETAGSQDTVTVIEWSQVVKSVLPSGHLELHLSSPSESSRVIVAHAHGTRYEEIIKGLR